VSYCWYFLIFLANLGLLMLSEVCSRFNPTHSTLPTKVYRISRTQLLGGVQYIRRELLPSVIPAFISQSVGRLCKKGWTDRRPVCGGESWSPNKHWIRWCPYPPLRGVRYGLCQITLATCYSQCHTILQFLFVFADGHQDGRSSLHFRTTAHECCAKRGSVHLMI